MPKTKSQQIREALASRNYIGALRIASHFHDRSPATRTYKRGFDAHNHPQFYRQLGHDPEELTDAAIDLLRERFD
jgi:hypothetical protein